MFHFNLRKALAIVASYACAAAISKHVSMDLTETNWFSAWTYIWFFFAMPLVVLILAGITWFVSKFIVDI